MKKVLIMAGGTGGHIFPALAVARSLEGMGCKIFWLGSIGSMESRILSKESGIVLELLPIKGVRGNGILRKLYTPFMLIRSCYLAYRIIKKYDIDIMVGFGSFITIPGGLLSKLIGVPLFLHEQNAVLGLSNRILSRISVKNFYAFPGVFKDPDGLVGNPVRKEIELADDPDIRFSGREGVLKVLILGGSLGASVFNDLLPLVFSRIEEGKRPLIYHQCGLGNSGKVRDLYRGFGVFAHCFDFLERIEEYYSDVDFIICRAGALTIAEISVVGLGGILVPFPFAVDDHQTKNAQYLLDNGAIDLIDQKDFKVDFVVDKILSLDRDKCLAWARNSRKLGNMGAAQKMSRMILDIDYEY